MRFACPRCGNVADAPSTTGLVCVRCGFGEAPPIAWGGGNAPPPPMQSGAAAPPLGGWPAATLPYASPYGTYAYPPPPGWPQPSWSAPAPATAVPPSGPLPDDPRYTYGPPENRNDGFAIAGFILAFLPTLSILGIVFCGVSLGRMRKDPTLRGKGMAQSGLAVGITMTVIMALFIVQVPEPV